MHTTNTDYIIVNGHLYRDTRSIVIGHDGPTPVVDRDLVLSKDSRLWGSNCDPSARAVHLTSTG